MCRCEVASFSCRVGSHPGLVYGRASESCAKPDRQALISGGPVATQAVSRRRVDMVVHAITSGQRHSHLTGEVPPRLELIPPVNAGYKASPKGQRDARVARTVSHWPRLRGCQQRQSRFPSVMAGTERQNHREFGIRSGFRGKVSRLIKATKGPAGISFRQTDRPLRNNLSRPSSGVGQFKDYRDTA